MPVLNRVAEMQREIAGWRRWLHERPEIGFALDGTAEFVAGKLEAFGCDEIVRGVGVSGVVAVIRGRHGPGPSIGLRADMDALPSVEQGEAAHVSKRAGKMHACGQDGHTAMLLGTA